MGDATLTGTARVSGVSGVVTQAYTLNVSAVSAYFADQFILSAGLSDFIVSVPTVSNPDFLIVTATGVVRINYSGEASGVSAGSAGRQMTGLVHIGQSISGPLGLHFSNSNASAVTITIVAAM